jgi:hypothetical protein
MLQSIVKEFRHLALSITNYIQHNVNNAVTAKISMTGVHYDRGTCACSVGMVHSSRHLCTTWPVFLLLLIIPATNVAKVGRLEVIELGLTVSRA